MLHAITFFNFNATMFEVIGKKMLPVLLSLNLYHAKTSLTCIG